MAAAARRHDLEVEHSSAGDATATTIEQELGLPLVDGILEVPRRLLAEDELDLRWRFDDPRLASIRGSSDFGAQLARAESYGFGALPCRACGGTWRRRQRGTEELITDWRDGTGRRPKKHFGQQESYSTALARYRSEMCLAGLQLRAGGPTYKVVRVSKHNDDPALHAAEAAAFRLRGEVALTEAEVREWWPTLPDSWTVPCPACKGIGVVPRRSSTHAEVTVWPTGSSKRPGAREAISADELVARAATKGVAVWDGYSGVSLTELERFLSIELVLRDVAELSVPARVVLEEYYGPKQKRRHGQPLCSSRGNPIITERTSNRAVGLQALWPLTSVENAKTEAEKSRRAAEVAALYAHGCGVFNLAAYGGAS